MLQKGCVQCPLLPPVTHTQFPRRGEAYHRPGTIEDGESPLQDGSCVFICWMRTRRHRERRDDLPDHPAVSGRAGTHPRSPLTPETMLFPPCRLAFISSGYHWLETQFQKKIEVFFCEHPLNVVVGPRGVAGGEMTVQSEQQDLPSWLWMTGESFHLPEPLCFPL